MPITVVASRSAARSRLTTSGIRRPPLYATTVSAAAMARSSVSRPAVTGTSASTSVPSTSGIRLAAASACMAVIPGITSTTTSGSRSDTVAAR